MSDPLGLIGNVGGAGGINRLGGPKPAAGPTPTESFKDVLMKNLEQVNRLQADAERAVEDLAIGKRDLTSVTIAQEKANLAFQALLQVRNKLMDAYEEVKQIRV